MRILVTGASGFVGSRTCDHLEVAGHDIVRCVSPRHSEIPTSQVYSVDLSDPRSVDRLNRLGSFDAVVHSAGVAHRFGNTSGSEFRRVNVEGSKNVAELAVNLGARKFVHLSSVMVYGGGHGGRSVSEDKTPSPDDAYSRSKLEGEQVVKSSLHGRSVDLTILRPAPIIGEGSKGNVSRLIRAIDNGSFRWIGDGRNQRSFVYVGDVPRAVEFALNLDHRNCVFNLVGGNVTVAGLVNTIAKGLGKQITGFRVPENLARLSRTMSRPLRKIPVIGRYQRTLETWMADAVYAGDAIESCGFRPATTIEQALNLEVDRYLESR